MSDLKGLQISTLSWGEERAEVQVIIKNIISICLSFQMSALHCLGSADVNHGKPALNLFQSYEKTHDA